MERQAFQGRLRTVEDEEHPPSWEELFETALHEWLDPELELVMLGGEG